MSGASTFHPKPLNAKPLNPKPYIRGHVEMAPWADIRKEGIMPITRIPQNEPSLCGTAVCGYLNEPEHVCGLLTTDAA